RTREAGIEGTAHRTNMEAASEIARQLRLRDIGGLIVIDFIDMRGRSNIRDVERQLREAMKKDTARYDLTKISKLGLLEMSRQRMRAGPAASSYRPCKTCEGSGVVKTVESASLSILRRIHTRSARGDLARIRILLPEEVARYLLNRKRADLVRLEERYMTEIQIIGRSDMNLTDLQFEVQSRDDRAREQGKDVEPQVKHPETQEGSERSRKSERAGKRVRRRRAGEKKDSGQSAGAPAEVAVAAVPEKPAAESGPRPVRRRGRRRKTGEKKDAAQVASDSDQGRSDAESGASDAVPRPPAAESVPQPVRRRARRRRTGEKKESVRAAADSGQGGSRTGSSVGDSSSPAAAAPVSQPAGRRARRRRSGGKQASLANSGEDRGDLSRKVPGDGEPGAEGAGKGKKPIRRRRPRGGRSRKSRAAGKGAPPSSNGQMEGPNQSESQPADLRITGPPDVVSGSDMKPASVAEPGTESPRPARREAGARNSAS
ncbi:MAG: ribonuclease E/G, partial [Acidobacteriota bacterium]